MSHMRARGGWYIQSRMLAAVFREPQWSPCVYQMLRRWPIGYSKRNMSSICAYAPLSFRSLPRRKAKFSRAGGIGEILAAVARRTGAFAVAGADVDGRTAVVRRGNMGHFPAFIRDGPVLNFARLAIFDTPHCRRSTVLQRGAKEGADAFALRMTRVSN